MNSTEFGAQIGQLLFKSTLKGVWMAIVLMWGIFVAAWPAFLLLGVIVVISWRFR